VLAIDTEAYPKHFLYKIYECFKPTNLSQTRAYISYLIGSDQHSEQIKQYESTLTDTQLPDYIR
jgi:hypothetical protein